MLAKDYISHEIPVLKMDDTVKQVLLWMEEYRVMHLPVFSNASYIGLISEADLLGHADTDAPLSKLESRFMKVAVGDERSVYDVIKLLDDYKLSMIPVLDKEGHFQGTISYKEVMNALVSMFNLNVEGAVFILEMNYADYSLSEISRHIESNDARVLSSHVSFNEVNNNVDVTIKVNTESISSILQTLERYDYVVKATFQDQAGDDGTTDRYDALLRYLNT
jgi:acetoin utilization protein AcuB